MSGASSTPCLGEVRERLYAEMRRLWCAYSVIEACEEGETQLLPTARKLMGRSVRVISELRDELEDR